MLHVQVMVFIESSKTTLLKTTKATEKMHSKKLMCHS